MSLLSRYALAIWTALGCSLVVAPTAEAHWEPPAVNHYKRVTNVRNNYSWHRNYRPTAISERNYNSEYNDDVRDDSTVINENTLTEQNGPVASPASSSHDLWILSVGVNVKRLEAGSLPDNNAPFARQVANLLRQHGKNVYENVHARLLTGPHATRQSILAGFDWLRTHARPGDVSVVFLTGHGSVWGGNFFMIPAKHGNDNWQKKVVWGQEIREALLEIPGQKVLLLGTCTAGSILQTPAAPHGLPNTEIICCCRAHEIAGPSFAMNNALVRGLKGAAVNQQGVVTVGSLVHYLNTQVRQVTHDKQHLAVAGPRHTGANDGSTSSLMSGLALGA